MKTILFPTDFSENANHAMQFALQLAKDFDARLHIINTYQIPYATSVPNVYNLLEALKKNSIDDLNKCVNGIKSNPDYNNLNITHDAISGDLINAIAEIESNHSIDLIVLGTKGASGIKEILIGSNAEQVVYHSKSSVLVVPNQTTEFSFNNITLASDLTPVDEKKFNTFVSLCKKYQAKVTVVSIQPTNKVNKNETTNHHQLNEILSGIEHHFQMINNDDISNSLNSFVEENQSNILALISKKYSFFENIFHKSITNKLACHTKIPIFVIKEK